MRLIIHGGIHRTGTTTLQRFFSGSRDQLLQQGFLYPFDATNHQRLAWDILAGRLSGPEMLRQLQKAGEGVEATAILLSGEDFCIHKDLRWLTPIRRHFDVEAHFYLRRQDNWLMSWYNQHIKWPFEKRKSRLNSDEFLQTIEDYYWLNYYWLAANWSEALGKNSVHLHVFEEKTDVVADFCGRLGLRPDGGSAPPKSENASLPPQLLEFVRHFDLHSLAPGERTRFLSGLRRAWQDKKLPPSNVYSPAVRNLILSRFAESNRRTAIEYLSKANGQLFSAESVPPDEPYSTPRLPSSAELMRDYVVPLVRALVAAKGK